MITYFISDLHLRGDQPRLLQHFEYFIDHIATDADTLYILGDLFEVWLGDDMVLPDYGPALAALQRLSKRGVAVFIMYGNRDFLMREQFCRDSGAQLLAEPAVIDLAGQTTLLMHGDILCTDDVRYQQFRAMVRDPAFQAQFLAKSSQERLAIVREYRQMSKTETQYKSADIMDVNASEVEQAFRTHAVSRLIHGHTHRPAIHSLTIDGQPVQRIVLGDWEQHGSYLRCDEGSCDLKTFNC
jgi:UDP-2,3-diacylglucosamine hydrolase